MTTLIAWLAVDSRKPSSIYLASDSRLFWENVGLLWDVGKKIFAAKSMPEIFGYAGDVLFPNQVLGQLCEQIDTGVLFSNEASFKEKFEIVQQRINNSFISYPKHKDIKKGFQILYISRTGIKESLEFHAGRIDWSEKSGFTANIVKLPKQSGLIAALGTGGEYVKTCNVDWQKSDVKGTSRSVFSAFCDALENGEDKASGGAPQLIGLYEIGQPQVFGIIWQNQRYISGQPFLNNSKLNNIEWRNNKFERCNPDSMFIQEDAQPQPRPKM
jgi:hypothetical protein